MSTPKIGAFRWIEGTSPERRQSERRFLGDRRGYLSADARGWIAEVIERSLENGISEESFFEGIIPDKQAAIRSIYREVKNVREGKA